MCFLGGGDDERLEGQPDEFKDWVNDNGRLDKFGSLEKAQSAYARAQGGSANSPFTNQAQVPGPGAPGADFLGPRIDDERTGADDLKNLSAPKIDAPSSPSVSEPTPEPTTPEPSTPQPPTTYGPATPPHIRRH